MPRRREHARKKNIDHVRCVRRERERTCHPVRVRLSRGTFDRAKIHQDAAAPRRSSRRVRLRCWSEIAMFSTIVRPSTVIVHDAKHASRGRRGRAEKASAETRRRLYPVRRDK